MIENYLNFNKSPKINEDSFYTKLINTKEIKQFPQDDPGYYKFNLKEYSKINDNGYIYGTDYDHLKITDKKIVKVESNMYSWMGLKDEKNTLNRPVYPLIDTDKPFENIYESGLNMVLNSIKKN